MISNLLIVLAAAAASLALRSYSVRWMFRLGTLGIVVTSFLAGWLLGGSWGLGLMCAASWLLLPWLEILTRVRRMRLPIDRRLEARTPPNRASFPGFEDLTSEIEEAGFEHLKDVGWDTDDTRHFYRIFCHAKGGTQASICLTEQEDFAFYYLSLTTRTADGRVFLTWNYPFSYGMKVFPELVTKRVPGSRSFSEMADEHQALLSRHGIRDVQIIELGSEETLQAMQAEMRAQIVHNLELGLLKRDGERFFRYTVRGMFFLWFQFLRDLVRLS